VVYMLGSSLVTLSLLLSLSNRCRETALRTHPHIRLVHHPCMGLLVLSHQAGRLNKGSLLFPEVKCSLAPNRLLYLLVMTLHLLTRTSLSGK
jgi:hypothetical protein